MLWRVWQRTVMTLAQRQEFRAARRLLREALADPHFPAALAETFKELFSGTFSGEIGQLTAQAIRSMQEARESDALASLQRAETLLDTLNGEALPPSRRRGGQSAPVVGLQQARRPARRGRLSTNQRWSRSSTRSRTTSAPRAGRRRSPFWPALSTASPTPARSPCASWPTPAIARPRSCSATSSGRSCAAPPRWA
jgi:hypothetical protein